MRGRVIAGAIVVVGSMLGLTMSQASSTTSAHTQHITGFTDNPSENGIGSIWAAGPISGHGHDVPIDEHTDRFVFDRGAITVTHHATSQHDNFDAAVCTFQHEERGVYSVTGGTGAYAHAHGSGSYRLDVVGQGCNENQPPKVFTIVLEAAGPLTLG